MRLRGRHPIAGEEELLGLARPHFPWVREIFHTIDPKADSVIDKLGILARDDDVAWPDQHETAHDAAALHRRDRRLGQVAPALTQADVDLFLPRHLRLGAHALEP